MQIKESSSAQSKSATTVEEAEEPRGANGSQSKGEGDEASSCCQSKGETEEAGSSWRTTYEETGKE